MNSSVALNGSLALNECSGLNIANDQSVNGIFGGGNPIASNEGEPEIIVLVKFKEKVSLTHIQINGGAEMPVVIAPIGKPLKVIRILTDEKTKKHLESLGITINSELSVLSESGGSIILLVKDGRLALDKVLATKIMVV